MSGQLGFRFLMLVVKSIALSDGKTEVMYRKNSFCMKAIEFLALIKKDPKNLYRKGELDCCIDELRDYLLGGNGYNTTKEQLVKYYVAFLSKIIFSVCDRTRW